MTTATVLIDKFAFVQSLEKRGFTRAQAEAIADTVTDIALAQLVSKVDMREALSELKVELLKFIRCHGRANCAHRRSHRTSEIALNWPRFRRARYRRDEQRLRATDLGRARRGVAGRDRPRQTVRRFVSASLRHKLQSQVDQRPRRPRS